MSGFDESGWGEAEYDQEYRDSADIIIPQRATLLRIVASFFRTFVAQSEVGRSDAHDIPPTRVLDLGCGDGILTETLSGQIETGMRMPDFTLMDGSAGMLQAARKRLAGLAVSEYCQVTFEEVIAGEFRRPPYDLIVSSFAIHHLVSEQKAALFRRLYNLLVPGGFVLNTDVALSGYDPYTEWYHVLWRQWIAARQRNLSLTEDFTRIIEEAPDKEENHYEALDAQLDALTGAGFSHVTCHYRYGLFAIYGGQRLK
jgi:tRNA (cmo5U34)-methyltransferase